MALLPSIPPVPSAPPANFFHLEIPATLRMVVTASNEREARRILAALLGDGTWQPAALAGTPVKFSVRVNK